MINSLLKFPAPCPPPRGKKKCLRGLLCGCPESVEPWPHRPRLKPQALGGRRPRFLPGLPSAVRVRVLSSLCICICLRFFCHQDLPWQPLLILIPSVKTRLPVRSCPEERGVRTPTSEFLPSPWQRPLMWTVTIDVILGNWPLWLLWIWNENRLTVWTVSHTQILSNLPS